MNVLLLTAAILMAAPNDPGHSPILEQALKSCPRYATNPGSIPKGQVRALFYLESSEGVPPEAHGLLAAAACWESGYKLHGKCGDHGRSCGIVQLHGSWSKEVKALIDDEMGGECASLEAWKKVAVKRLVKMGLGKWTAAKLANDPRRCWEAAATVWLRRMKRNLPKVDKFCKGEGGYATRGEFLVASATLTAVRRGRCVQHNAKGKCVKRSKNPHCAIAGRYETKHWAKVLRVWKEGAR